MIRPSGWFRRLIQAQIDAPHLVRNALMQAGAEGAHVIQRLWVPYMEWPVQYRTSHNIRSHFGRDIGLPRRTCPRAD
jgi:hypothetical protein